MGGEGEQQPERLILQEKIADTYLKGVLLKSAEYNGTV